MNCDSGDDESELISCRYLKQEASLTLREQRGRCINIKGDTQIFGSFHNLRPPPLFPLGVIL